MPQAQLPAHLQNRQVKSLTERASEGMGGALPPHVSIQGNSFTFVDAAGNEFQPMLTFDAVIIDMADLMNKRYYDKPFDPNASTYEPPRCWSANGIAPVREVASPIHPTCEGCPANVRGSAISKISGAAIKACRDEKWIAFIVPALPTVIFQLVITPGSFQNWKAYTETMKANRAELSLAITRFSFQPKVNGVLLFEFVNWIDEPTLLAVEAANREGKTDALVGRSDPVRQPALAAPAQAQQPSQQVLPPNQLQPVQPQQELIPPGQPTPFVPAAAAHPAPTASAPSLLPSAGSTSLSPTASPAGGATLASPSEAAPRRRRRTAEGAPVGPAFGQAAPAASQAPFGQPAQAAPAAVMQAPAGGGAGVGQQFGIAPGAPVNPEMLAMLEQMGFRREAPQQ